MSKGDGARGYLVECYWPGVTEQAVADAAHRAVQAAAEIRRQGHDVNFLTAILVPADETVFCLFEGSSASSKAKKQRCERLATERGFRSNGCSSQYASTGTTHRRPGGDHAGSPAKA